MHLYTNPHASPQTNSQTLTHAHTHTHTLSYSPLRQQDMASPGLNPVLFFLALDAAKPAGGYAAAQWSNGAGPALGTEHTEIHRTLWNPSSSPKCWDRIGHGANVRLCTKRKDTRTVTAQGHTNRPACVPLSVCWQRLIPVPLVELCLTDKCWMEGNIWTVGQ